VTTTETRRRRTTEEPPASDIEPSDEATKPEDGDQGGGALFDRSQYEREDLIIAKVDGNPIDRIALTFAGTVYLDRSDPADVALYNKLALGRDVTLMVEGRCNATGAKGATDREGELDVIVGQKGVKVGTVYVPVLGEAG
jgi:hypothetical protein